MSQRISRDELFFALAQAFAERSTCLRAHVGAVVVDHGHVLSHGYNGAPMDMPHCTEVGCDLLTVWQEIPHSIHKNVSTPIELGCQRAIHAEANAVAYAAKEGVSLKGTTIYSTHEPCRKCAELIIQAGIRRVKFIVPYRLGASDFLDQANIQVEQQR